MDALVLGDRVLVKNSGFTRAGTPTAESDQCTEEDVLFGDAVAKPGALLSILFAVFYFAVLVPAGVVVRSSRWLLRRSERTERSPGWRAPAITDEERLL